MFYVETGPMVRSVEKKMKSTCIFTFSQLAPLRKRSCASFAQAAVMYLYRWFTFGQNLPPGFGQR